MKAPSTDRHGRAAAKSPSTPLPVILALLTGLSLHCGTGHGAGGTSGDGGNQSVEPDASSDTGTPSSDGSSSDSQGSPMEAGREDGATAPPVEASTDARTDAPTDGTASDAGETGSSSAALAFDADRVIVTGVRGTATPAAQTVIRLHNAGATSARVTGLALGGANASLFTVTTAVPATVMAGSDLQVTVEMTTTGAGLPALPPGPAPYDSGSNSLTATLTATWDSGSAQASVFGLLLVQGNSPGPAYEPTLGQIITALGYPINVGQAQNDWNPNTSMMAADLPGVEPNTDEVAAPLFVKATATGSVTLNVVARFSQAMRTATVYANTHPAETAPLIATFVGVDVATVMASKRVICAEYLDPREIQPPIDAAAKYKVIERAFPAQEMISPDALKPGAR